MEIDSEGKFTYVSPQIFDMFGYTQEESIGLAAFDFVHPHDIERCMKAMDTMDEVKHLEYHSRHKDGHYVHVSTSGRIISDAVGGFKIVSVLRDITERRQAEMESRLLQKLTMAISEAPDLQTALNSTLTLTCEHTGWVIGEAWIPNHDETVLEYCLGYCDDSDEHADRLRRFRESSKQFTFPQGVGLPGRVWSSMQPEWRNDVASLSEEIYLRVKPSKEAGLKAALGVPIISNGQVLTVLVFYMTTPQPEDERQIKLFAAVAAQLGTGILRKRAEKALKSSNEDFQQVVSNITCIIWKADIGNNGAFENTYISPVVDELLELPAGTMKNDWNKFFSYIKSEYLERVNNAFREAIISPANTLDFEYEVLKGNGQTAWFYSKGRCFEKDGNLHVFGSTMDITERKQAEEKINAKSHFLESLIQQSPLPTFVMDSKGFTVMVNEAFLKFYAVPDKEMILGRNALTEPANVSQGVVKYFKEALSGKIVEVPEIEFVSPHKNKKSIARCRMFPIVDPTGTLTNVVVVQEDITKRKWAVEALKESETQYRNLYSMMRLMSDNLPDLIWTKDIEGRFLFVNKACSEILLDAKDTDEPIGKTDIYFADRMMKCNFSISTCNIGEIVTSQ